MQKRKRKERPRIVTDPKEKTPGVVVGFELIYTFIQRIIQKPYTEGRLWKNFNHFSLVAKISEPSCAISISLNCPELELYLDLNHGQS